MKQTVVFSVHDLKVYKLTALGDAETDPTYEAAVDVPGVSEVGLDPEISNAVLRGDGRVMDSRSSLDSLDVSFTYGKLSPDVLAVIDGGTAQTEGGVTRYVRKAGDKLPRWAFAALISEVDNPDGAAKLYGYLCNQTGGSLFAAQDNDYGQPSVDATLIGLPKGPMWALDLEDTGTALPEDGSALVATYGALAGA